MNLKEAEFSMKKLIVWLLLAAMTVMVIPTALANETWYVYTSDGKTLNVRAQPNGEVIDKIAFGTSVEVIVYEPNGWSLIWHRINDPEFPREGEAYVMSRYLVRSKPSRSSINGGTSNSGKSSSTQPSQQTTTDTSKVLADMNKEFRTARKVSPYTVISRPTRASGWVNLRWGPNTETERITTCPQGKELTVLCELQNWYQVEDPTTGMIGFIARKYVTKK